MTSEPKHEKTKLRQQVRQKVFRRRWLQLVIIAKMDSQDAVDLMSKEFNLTSARIFGVVRPADLRRLLKADWDEVMKTYGLEIPKPDEITSIDDLGISVYSLNDKCTCK